MKSKQETKQEQAEKPGLELTEQQIADFTRLAELQKDGSANSKARKRITDAYRAFAEDNQGALAAESGVRAGKLKVWVEVKRELHAMIVE
jgi:hypothetical protein